MAAEIGKIMLVTRGKFLQYQNIFYKKLLATPYKIQLEIVSVAPKAETEEFSMDDFVGDNPRTSAFYTFRALYEKEIPTRTREKYGLPKEVNGVVYLSPKQLVPVFGTYRLDWNKTKVHFEHSTQVIEKIIYLEEFVEYGSCVGVQIFLKDDLKGG